MEQRSNSKKTIIACGRPGVGKSAIGNSLLYGKPQCDYGFQSYSDPTKWGVTREVQKRTKYIPVYNTNIQYVDIPGSGDHTLDMVKFTESLLSELKNDQINAIFFVLSSCDERFTLQELCAIQFVKSFFKLNQSNSEKILWLVISHCDQKEPNLHFIWQKLYALEQQGLLLNQQNVLYYGLRFFNFQRFEDRVLKSSSSQYCTVVQDQQRNLNQFYQGINKINNSKEQEMQIEENKFIQESLKKLKNDLEREQKKQQNLQEQINKFEEQLKRLK